MFPHLSILTYHASSMEAAIQSPTRAVLSIRPPEVIQKDLGRWYWHLGLGCPGKLSPALDSAPSRLILCVKVFYFATNEPMFPVVKWGLTDEEVDQNHWYHISRIFKTDEPVHESFLRYLKGKLPNFGSRNIQRLVSFLLLMMEQDPRKRMPTTKLLEHPFLVENPEWREFSWFQLKSATVSLCGKYAAVRWCLCLWCFFSKIF